jgi:hypothetical protein
LLCRDGSAAGRPDSISDVAAGTTNVHISVAAKTNACLFERLEELCELMDVHFWQILLQKSVAIGREA